MAAVAAAITRAVTATATTERMNIVAARIPHPLPLNKPVVEFATIDHRHAGRVHRADPAPSRRPAERGPRQGHDARGGPAAVRPAPLLSRLICSSRTGGDPSPATSCGSHCGGRADVMAVRTVGLTSVGGYVPRYRLSGKSLAQVWGAGGGGERAVANYDEGTLTIGCEAAPNAIGGRGGGAALVGADGVIASFEGAFTVSHEFTDFWRNDGDRYVQALPDMTFIKSHGLDKHLPEAIDGVLQKTGRKREDIAKLVLYGPDARTHAALVRQLRFPETAMPREPVIVRAGNTGAAACLLGLAAALEEVKPHDHILVVSYGNGAEALLFEATDAIAAYRPARPVAQQLAAGRPLTHYGKLLRFRRHVETEVIRSFSSVPTMVRDERQHFP